MSVLELVATDINDYGFSGSINKFTLSIIAIRQIIFREMHFCISQIHNRSAIFQGV